MEFWTEPQMASIHKMLNPRSIAIVGATPRMQYGGRFLAAALKAKDRVRVYAVNPRYDEIMGVKSHPSVTDLPEAPDLVGIVVPYDQVLDVLQESHRKGTGSAIVISAGAKPDRISRSLRRLSRGRGRGVEEQPGAFRPQPLQRRGQGGAAHRAAARLRRPRRRLVRRRDRRRARPPLRPRPNRL